MFQKQLHIPHLNSGGLMTNYFCSSACRHCLYRCSPRWPKDYITPEAASRNFETILRLGCRSVHIGGGEPLLRPDALADVLGVANAMGVYVDYVETNSSWFKTHKEAYTILEYLANKGLRTLLVSISPFHNEFIPFYKIKGVMNACQQTGISVFPWISDFLSDLGTFHEQQTHSLEEYQQYFGDHYVANLPRRYWISSGGRALDTFGQYAPKHSADEIVAASRHGCSELTEVSHFHIDLYENYVPGLCAGLSIRQEDLGTRLSPDRYPILSRLYSQGIGALLTYAAQEYGFVPNDESGYALKCDLCYDIRRFLVVERELDSPELQPRGHYLYG
jgi:uncharacterized Fe-S cluster-containing radical SAM superfamily protein